MKKILFTLFAVLSISSFAKTNDYNFYLKGGIVYGNGEKLQKSIVNFSETAKENETIKGLMTLSETMLSRGSFKDYINDPTSKAALKDGIELFKDNVLDKSNNKINYILNFEATKNINENVEFGVGTAYIYNAKRGIKLSNEEIATIGKESLDSKVEKLDGKESVGTIFYKKITQQASGLKLDLKEPKYDILPFYLTTKYNFTALNKNVKPYIKADFGYAIPVNIKNISADLGKLKTGDSIAIQLLKNFSETFLSAMQIKVKGGIYLGISAGVEYNRLLTELGIFYIGGKVNLKSGSIESETDTSDVQVMLKVGYKF